jgi:putative (di)nucleoside polyphosphate hydrolase
VYQSGKPYRINVGISLFNSDGLVFVGRRFRSIGPEIILPGHEWQMPQGGIQDGEKPYSAALRELFEETGVIHTEYLGETDWLTYDFPPYFGPPHRLSRFRGQRQKWIALRFTGTEDEIDVQQLRGAEPEFDIWRWEHLSSLPALVVPFKRAVYKQVEQVFSIFTRG